MQTADKEEFPMVNLWLDDVRPAPDGWVHAKSVEQAKVHLLFGTVEFASLDHDMGDYAADGGDGIHLVNWCAEHDLWPSRGVRVHSANPVGRAAMLFAIDHDGPYPLGYSNFRGEWSDGRGRPLSNAL